MFSIAYLDFEVLGPQEILRPSVGRSWLSVIMRIASNIPHASQNPHAFRNRGPNVRDLGLRPVIS